MTATVLRQGSSMAIRFLCVGALEDLYRGGDHTKPVPTAFVGAFGAFAGAIGVLLNTPLDVVKTRMQGLEASRYKNTLDCAVTTWREEGPLAFYKGTIPRLVRVGMSVGIQFALYGSFYRLINKIWP